MNEATIGIYYFPAIFDFFVGLNIEIATFSYPHLYLRIIKAMTRAALLLMPILQWMSMLPCDNPFLIYS